MNEMYVNTEEFRAAISSVLALKGVVAVEFATTSSALELRAYQPSLVYSCHCICASAPDQRAHTVRIPIQQLRMLEYIEVATTAMKLALSDRALRVDNRHAFTGVEPCATSTDTPSDHWCISAPEFKKLLIAAKAASTDKARHILQCVYLDNNAPYHAVATDAHAMAVIEFGADEAGASVAIPAELLKRAARLAAAKTGAPFVLSETGKTLSIRCGNEAVHAPAVYGSYPSWRDVVPAATEAVATASLQEVLPVLKDMARYPKQPAGWHAPVWIATEKDGSLRIGARPAGVARTWTGTTQSCTYCSTCMTAIDARYVALVAGILGNKTHGGSFTLYGDQRVMRFTLQGVTLLVSPLFVAKLKIQNPLVLP